MNDIINKVFKKYESIYKKYEGEEDKNATFSAINNAMLVLYFSKNTSEESCLDYIYGLEKEYGVQILFPVSTENSNYFERFTFALETLRNDVGQCDATSFEKILGHVLEKHINRRETGSYYTPEDTTDYIAHNAIMIALLKKSNNDLRFRLQTLLDIEKPGDILKKYKNHYTCVKEAFYNLTENEKNELLSVISSLKIIDPTCGSGAFVIGAFDYLYELRALLERKVNIQAILKSLYGVDIESDAVNLTKLRLILKCVMREESLDYFKLDFTSHFKVADAIIGADYVFEEDGFDWRSFSPKFDCIIGNPPYVEASKYVSANFKSQKCGNLYAHVIERTCNIVAENGVVSLIVPLSFISTPRMNPSRTYLESRCSEVWYASFADRPGCIFSGVHQKLLIFFGNIGNSTKRETYTTTYIHWYNDERRNLFNNIKFVKNNSKEVVSRIGNKTELRVFKKLTSGSRSLFDLLNENENEFPIYLCTRMCFWTKAFMSVDTVSNEYKVYYAKSKDEQILAEAILNSSLFYFYWFVSADGWHITNSNLKGITFDPNKVSEISVKKLERTVNELTLDLEKNKKYVGTKQVEYEYKHKYSKKILDEIDEEIYGLFGLTTDEYRYITSINEKYRVNNNEQ